MDSESVEEFLREMHDLIQKKHRHFVRRDRNGKNYIQQLAELGIGSIDEAWAYILKLEGKHRHSGPEYDHTDTGRSEGKVIWTFKMEVNGQFAYIKLKLVSSGPRCRCMAFHVDEP